MTSAHWSLGLAPTLTWKTVRMMDGWMYLFNYLFINPHVMSFKANWTYIIHMYFSSYQNKNHKNLVVLVVVFVTIVSADFIFVKLWGSISSQCYKASSLVHSQSDKHFSDILGWLTVERGRKGCRKTSHNWTQDLERLCLSCLNKAPVANMTHYYCWV